jgi:hypothetical protein
MTQGAAYDFSALSIGKIGDRAGINDIDVGTIIESYLRIARILEKPANAGCFGKI